MLKIRKFNKRDTSGAIDAITSSLMDVFNCSKEKLGKELIDDLSNIKSNYFDKGGYFFVAVLNNKIVGTVAVKNYSKNIAKLGRMYVNPAYHGKGIGSKLYDTAEDWCKKQ